MKMYGLSLLIPTVVIAVVPNAFAENTDQFNYRATDTSDNRDFGPEQWDDVECPDEDSCLGWPFDSWLFARGWSVGGNQCRWCPDLGNKCGGHNQSPVDLKREVGLEGHKHYKECIDWHWMKYEPGHCDWTDMVDNPYSEHRNNFKIERHGLQILSPTIDGDPKCPHGGGGGNFPRVDFSKGFKWWWLTSTDISVPSEHTQEGRQYHAEIHLSHVYSLTPEEHRDNREMGKIAIFMHAYDGIPPWPFLDKMICQWRLVEDKTREECGLDSVAPYPGCFNANRQTNRKLRATNTTKTTTNTKTMLRRKPKSENEYERMRSVNIPKSNYEQNPNFTVTDFEQMIEDYNADHNLWRREQSFDENDHRHLINFDHIPYFAYEWMLKVQTEYYTRYEGSQTVPPCFQQVHWRIMKDPIRVHMRQIKELERLIADRIAPKGSEFHECQPDTAGKQRPNSDAVDVNRPLQSWRMSLGMKFCECRDWGSKQYPDKDWCKLQMTTRERFYDHPYNFETDGF